MPFRSLPHPLPPLTVLPGEAVTELPAADPAPPLALEPMPLAIPPFPLKGGGHGIKHAAGLRLQQSRRVLSRKTDVQASDTTG